MAEKTKKSGTKNSAGSSSKNGKIDFVKDIIRIVNDNDISEFKYEKDDIKLTIKRGHEVVSVPSVSVPVTEYTPAVAKSALKPVGEKEPENLNSNNYFEIKSPMIGTFYQAPSPTAPAFVKIGDRISMDTTVCIVEAMKLMNEIKAGINGVLKEVLVKDADGVKEGTILFRVDES